MFKLSPNKRRSGRARKERNKAVVEHRDAGLDQRTAGPEVEGSMEVKDEKNKNTESALTDSQPEVDEPPQSAQAPSSPVERGSGEPAESLHPTGAVPEIEQQTGGKKVADTRENVFESFSKMNDSVFNLEGVKKAAAWYIETSEKFANQALELQEKATSWAKDTPFAALFEAQQSIARKFVERSAHAARTLWQVPVTQ